MKFFEASYATEEKLPGDLLESPMSYNTKLEEKIDVAVQQWQKVEKKKMFGGVGYLLKGNRCIGIWKDFLIVRKDKEQGAKSLKLANVRPFDINQRSPE